MSIADGWQDWMGVAECPECVKPPHDGPCACAFCEQPAEGNYSIHRDGFGEGPEIALCDGCGSKTEPTLEEIWARISTTSST